MFSIKKILQSLHFLFSNFRLIFYLGLGYEK